jgi:hypothetical protein
VVVAVSILGIVLASLAALTFQVGRQSYVVSSLPHRSATMIQHMNRLSVLPFDLLPSRAGCVTVEQEPYPHTRCVTVDSLSPTVRQVTLVVAPVSTRLRADTVVFKRMKPTAPSPLDSP